MVRRRLLTAGLAVATLVVAGVLHFADAARPVSPVASACQKPDGRQVRIPGGSFLMGSNDFYEEEGPVHRETVATFWIDRFAVTNAQFARFVAATGYVTDAERAPDPADYPDIPKDQLVPGGAVFHTPDGLRHPTDPMQWWSFVPGADWRHPNGPGSGIEGHDDDPVVQVSYNDALAYAHWMGRELPTEQQFEYAARGGLDGKIYAWGDAFAPGGKLQANTWQGEFPVRDQGSNGFTGIAPVGCFPPNGYDLYDMIGNVWEWTSSPFSASDAEKGGKQMVRTIKGGSFLCAANYCKRYRPAAREKQDSSFSTMHLGFRTVSNRPPS